MSQAPSEFRLEFINFEPADTNDELRSIVLSAHEAASALLSEDEALTAVLFDEQDTPDIADINANNACLPEHTAGEDGDVFTIENADDGHTQAQQASGFPHIPMPDNTLPLASARPIHDLGVVHHNTFPLANAHPSYLGPDTSTYQFNTLPAEINPLTTKFTQKQRKFGRELACRETPVPGQVEKRSLRRTRDRHQAWDKEFKDHHFEESEINSLVAQEKKKLTPTRGTGDLDAAELAYIVLHCNDVGMRPVVMSMALILNTPNIPDRANKEEVESAMKTCKAWLSKSALHAQELAHIVLHCHDGDMTLRKMRKALEDTFSIVVDLPKLIQIEDVMKSCK